ncbi:MAG TPA: DUF167 domain-containing protein [Rhabdochlamydiaceae bacterium]
MIVTIKVIPRAQKNAIVGYENGILKVRLHAIPEKGEANEELIEFLSDVFDLPKSSITIVRGNTSRIKHVEIQGLTEDHIKKYCP